jgi:hypothetical protein
MTLECGLQLALILLLLNCHPEDVCRPDSRSIESNDRTDSALHSRADANGKPVPEAAIRDIDLWTA